MRLFSLTIAAVLLTSNVAIADQTDSRLDPLFGSLLITGDLTTIRATENQIWNIWFEHANTDVERLMQMGVQRMNSQRYPEALLIFNQIIDSFPDFAEAWNRRATLHYLVGNFDESIADIEKTLELEPRHFGALSGLGLVYLQRKELSKAREAFEDLIEVHPNSPNARQNLQSVIESLRLNVI
ncbi:MAG: tetratricopeptide repeat protein [Proteobacteria bacterium]|nr:tetratricopeptide repeat protein [Pseudomonadota bacterium]